MTDAPDLRTAQVSAASEGRPLPLVGSRSTLVVALAAVAVLVHLAASRDWGDGGFYVPWLGLAVLAAGALPALLRWIHVRRVGSAPDPIPFFPLIGVLFGVYYGLPVVTGEDVRVYGAEGHVGSLARGLEIALAGVACMLAGFYAVGAVVPVGRPLRFDWDPARAKRLAWWLILVGTISGFAERALDVPASLMQYVLLLSLLYQVGMGALVILQARGELGRSACWLLWGGVVPFYLFLQLGDGLIAKLAWAVAFLLLLFWATGRRVPWTVLAALVVATVVLRGVAEEYRRTYWRTDEEMSPLAKSTAFAELAADRWEEQGTDLFFDSVDLVSSRMAHVSLLWHVVDQTPREVPYWEGQTYATLFTSWIPRALWPGKPEKRLGQDFGHRYSILDPDDLSTSLNLPYLIEFYVNHGVLGVCLGMLLLGALYRMIYKKINTWECGDALLLVAAVMFSRMLNIESDLSLTFGNLLQTFVILVLVMQLARPRRRVTTLRLVGADEGSAHA